MAKKIRFVKSAAVFQQKKKGQGEARNDIVAETAGNGFPLILGTRKMNR